MPTELHISRIRLSTQCVIYSWMHSKAFESFGSGTASSIEACLTAASVMLNRHVGVLESVEIFYRKVAVGRFSVSLLDGCAAEIADLIEEGYGEARTRA